jgi:hypothetical protein
MASGPQPAFEGTTPGTTGPPPAPVPGSGAGVPARTVDPRRNGESAHGSQGQSGARAEPASRPAGPNGPRGPGGPGGQQPQRQRPNGGTAMQSRLFDGRAPRQPTQQRAPRRDPRRAARTRPVAATQVVTARRTRRVVRRIDVWTVLKMSVLFYLCVFLVFMVAGIVLWNIAQAFKVIGSVDKFIQSIFDLQQFTFRPMVVLQNSVLAGGVLVLLASGANVLAAVLYNLISDVVGGVQFIVLEETTPAEPE